MMQRYITFLFNFFARLHFGQHGEDVIVHKIFPHDFKSGFYMDIGAHHPFRQSNTAYLWLKGWSGINIDASDVTINAFKKMRPKDKNIVMAVVDAQTAKLKDKIELKYNPNVQFDLGATCDAETAIARAGVVTASKIVPCDSLDNIVEKYAPQSSEDFHFLNIDIEGFDTKAISGISEWRVKPMVICIEITDCKTIREVLECDTNKILESCGYQLIGKTGISSIYQLFNT